MQEKYLHNWWQQLPHNQRLTATCGSDVIIHHPGNYNKYAGPDFRNASISINGTRCKGSIEIHVRTTDWYHHQHHLDTRYRDIILHVVWENNSTDSSSIPGPLIELKNQSTPIQATLPQPVSPQQLRNWAQHRFKEKINIYQYQLQQKSFHQLIFTSFHRALGYPHNQYPFYLLACYVWNIFHKHEKILFSYRPEIIFTFLLLNSVRHFPPTSGVYVTINKFLPLLNTRFFIQLLKNNPPPALNFNLGGIHPVNHPHIKLKQLTTLYTKTTPISIVEKIKECLLERHYPGPLLKNLHRCFTIHEGTDNKSFLLSRNRITEWLLTDLIPLFFSATDSCNFRDYLSDLYFTLPAGYRTSNPLRSHITYGWENQAILHHQHQSR